MADGPSQKAASFLSNLRGGKGGARGGGLGGLGGGLGGLGGQPAGPAPGSEELVRPLQRRIDELEKKLQEVSKALTGPEEGEPPRPPSELMMYIHARTELLERKLQEAQAEALRANLLLHEREEAQRKAQKEVEDLFRNIKEQQNAARFDVALREQVSGAQQQIQDLKARLQEAELRAMPIEDVAKALKREDAIETLRREVEERVRRALPEAPAQEGSPPAPPAQSAHDIASDTGTVLMLTARIADLERSLQEAKTERDEERSRRATWEREIVASFAQANEKWRKGGGVEATVEAALQGMSHALRERDAAEEELKDAVDQAQSQPPGSPADPVLRARIAAAHERMDRLHDDLQQQLNIVQAWIAESR